LVNERFAAAGWHHYQGVFACQHALDSLLLAGAKAGNAKMLAQEADELGRHNAVIIFYYDASFGCKVQSGKFGVNLLGT
jgi:hypothetical protein